MFAWTICVAFGSYDCSAHVPLVRTIRTILSFGFGFGSRSPLTFLPSALLEGRCWCRGSHLRIPHTSLHLTFVRRCRSSIKLSIYGATFTPSLQFLQRDIPPNRR